MNQTAKLALIAAGGLLAVYFLTKKTPAIGSPMPAQSGAGQQSLISKMQTIGQQNNPTKYAKEVENLALPGQAAWGWTYYDNGVAIDPSGAYYLNGQKIPLN